MIKLTTGLNLYIVSSKQYINVKVTSGNNFCLFVCFPPFCNTVFQKQALAFHLVSPHGPSLTPHMTKPVLNQGMGYITQKLKGISVPLSAEEEKWKHTCTTENFKTEELYYSESLPWRVLGLQAIYTRRTWHSSSHGCQARLDTYARYFSSFCFQLNAPGRSAQL